MDEEYGITLRWLTPDKVGGEIKQSPEDFVVEELPLSFSGGENFTAFKVEKRDLTTFQAVKKIAGHLGLDPNDVGYAGLKDRYAVTRQWMSVEGDRRDGLEDLHMGNVSILDTRLTGDMIYKGDHRGNRFRITVRDMDVSGKEAEERLGKLSEEASRRGVPNFFGPQRFGGDRPVTHRVGRAVVKGDFQEAVWLYLTFQGEDERDEIEEAREKLSVEKDYGEALEYFPQSLGYERAMLRELADEEDWVRALRALPMGLANLLVDAYQSYLFNLSLSRFLTGKEEINNFPAPLPGYRTALRDRVFENVMEEVMEEEGVEPGDFFIQEIPEMSSKGAVRSAMMYPEIEYSVDGEDAELSFELKKGAYATVLLREIM